jgi:hypothetical protein
MQECRIPIGSHSVAAWRVGIGEKLLGPRRTGRAIGESNLRA